MNHSSQWIVLIDFDGTLTVEESLVVAARHLGVGDEFERLTLKAVGGEVDYNENLMARINMLAAFPVDKVARIVESVRLRPSLANLIKEHPQQCAILTSNLRCWCGGVAERLGCRIYCSEANVGADGLISTGVNLIDKAGIVRHFQSQDYCVIMIGDGANDEAALRAADKGFKI